MRKRQCVDKHRWTLRYTFRLPTRLRLWTLVLTVTLTRNARQHLKSRHPDGMDRQPPIHYQTDASQMEYSDDGNADFDDSQRHLVQTAATRRPMPVPGDEQSAGTETEYESAMSDGEDDVTVVDVATRETVQQPAATGSQQPPRLLRQPPPETSVSARIRARNPTAAPIAQPEASVSHENIQLADGNGSPQPPISARGTNPEPQPRLPAQDDGNRVPS